MTRPRGEVDWASARARDLLNRGRWGSAWTVVGWALRKEPANPDLLSLRGQTEWWLDRLQDARDSREHSRGRRRRPGRGPARGSSPAHWLGLFSPGRHLQLLVDLGEAIPSAGPPDMAQVAAVFAAHDTELV
jgi:hypothetical protein